MRTTWLIFVNSLQRMRVLVAGSFTAGILLGVVLLVTTHLLPGLETPIRLGYTDKDGSAVSADFRLYLTENLGMELIEGDEAWLEGELVNKKVSALVEVPAGFEQALLRDTKGALLVTYMGDYANRAFLQSYFESYVGSVQVLAASAQDDASKLRGLLAEAKADQAPLSTVRLDEQLEHRERDWDMFVLLYGFFVMISSLLIIGMASVVLDDRQNNTFQRVQVSGVNAVSYVVGVCAAGFLVAIVMVLIFILVCLQQGLGVNIPLGPILFMSLLYALFCVSFALVCALLCKSQLSCGWLILAISTIFCLLGGAYFPIEYSPYALQQLAHITPQFWLMDGVRQIAAGNSDAWVLSSGILALFSLLCFLVAGIRFASSSSKAM